MDKDMFKGLWSGHRIKAVLDNKEYILHTNIGVKGIDIPVYVQCVDSKWEYSEMENPIPDDFCTATLVDVDIKNTQIEKALDFGIQYGGIDGAHHKDWVIDQMIRALMNCPMIENTHPDSTGKEYTYEYQGESEEYKKLVKESCDGEDGPNTYEWDCGIAP